jgi:hypothetical protein
LNERSLEMLARKTILAAVAVSIVGLLLVGQSLSQPQQSQQRGQRGQRGGAQDTQRPQMQGGQFDPERMRQMMDQRMKEMFGATDQEWKILGPRVMKVQELSRQVGGGGRGGMMFGGMGRRGGQQGGPGGPGGGRFGGRPGAPGTEQTEVEKAMEQLRTLLENTSASPEQIKTQLTTLRSAREKAKQQLAVAQQELRQIITLRQEAQCVMMGMLD